MGLKFPKNAHGRPFKKAGVSAKTDVTAGRVSPSLDTWPVILLSDSAKGVAGFKVDEFGEPVPVFTADEAKSYLGEGVATELARFLFNPAPRGVEGILGAAEVYPFRVGAPTKASLNLDNGSAADAILLTTRDAGISVNDIEVKVDQTTVYRTDDTHILTFRQGKEVIASPELGPQFAMFYTGAGITTATVTITRTGGAAVTLVTAIAGVPADDLSLNLTNYATLDDLISYLNGLDNYTAYRLPEGDGSLPTADLDAESTSNLVDPATGGASENPTEIFADHIEFVTDIEAAGTMKVGDLVRESPTADWKLITNIDGKNVFVAETLIPDGSPAAAASIVTGLKLTSFLPSIVKYLNDESPFVTASVVEAGNDGSGVVDLVFTFISSETAGTNPALTTLDWLNAQTAITNKFRGRGMLLLVNSTDKIVQQSFADFSEDSYSKDLGVFPFFTGGALGETKANLLSRGAFIGSRFGRCTVIGMTIIDTLGATQSVGPMYLAAVACGQMSGSGLTQPLTFNNVPCVALERDDTDDDIRDFIQAGLIVAEKDPDKGFVFQIGVTCSQDSNRILNVAFIDHQRNTLEVLLRQAIKSLYLGKALTKFVQGGIRATAQRVMETQLDTGGTEAGYLQEIGPISVSSDGAGRVTVVTEPSYTDEFDFGNIEIKARVATFVDLSTTAAS